jgi:hypothetical protein
MELYDENFILRIIYSLVSVLLVIGMSFADFNKTHATHPDWPGHARFHVVWQVLSYYPIAIMNLFILWIYFPNFYYPYQLYFWLFWYFTFLGTFIFTILAMPLYGGTLSDKGGRKPFLYTFGEKLSLRPGKQKHLPFKINGEIKTYKFDENAHNMIAPTIIIIISTYLFLEL